MKMIGHAGCAVIAAAPLVWVYPRLPVEVAGGGGLPPMALFAWAVFFSAVPDFDILVGRVLPFVRHRGFLSHSIFTALAVAVLIAAVGLALPVLPDALGEFGDADGARRATGWLQQSAALAAYCNPFMALLAAVAVVSHILGDGLTVSGVPLWKPGQSWHVPIIGGHAAYDNYVLNAIPIALALWLLHAFFGLELESLRRLSHYAPFH